MPESSQPPHLPRGKFDTLFAEARHERGDLRLMRTAIRRGWVKPEDREALVQRFGEFLERGRDGDAGDGRWVRRALGQAWVVLEMERENLRGLRYTWGDEYTGQTTGRPRIRRRVKDGASVTVADLLRLADSKGVAPYMLGPVTLSWTGSDGVARQEFLSTAYAHAGGRWRLWLVCPQCGARRDSLYRTRVGCRCRVCARVRYR